MNRASRFGRRAVSLHHSKAQEREAGRARAWAQNLHPENESAELINTVLVNVGNELSSSFTDHSEKCHLSFLVFTPGGNYTLLHIQRAVK